MKQKRGCSRLVYATYTYTPAVGNTPASITFGTVKSLAPVKAITRNIEQASEQVYADNKLQEETFGASVVTRSFDVTGIEKDVEAELMGQSVVTVGTKKFTGTAQDGSSKPFVAVGYALHDGDKNRPCEVVWAFKAKVNSITSVSNTMAGNDTGSEGQTIEFNFYDPDLPWTATSKTDLDISEVITADNASDVETWFEQVVTYDNASTLFA